MVDPGTGTTLLKLESSTIGSALSPDGGKVATFNADGTIKLWHVPTVADVIFTGLKKSQEGKLNRDDWIKAFGSDKLFDA